MSFYTLLEQYSELFFAQQAARFSSMEVFFFTASTILAIIALMWAMIGSTRVLSPLSKIRMIVIALNVLVLDGLPCLRAYRIIRFSLDFGIISTILSLLLALMLYYAFSNGKGKASLFAFIAAWFGGCLGLSLWSVGFMFLLVLFGKLICPFILLGYLLCLMFGSSEEGEEKFAAVEQVVSKWKDSHSRKKEEPKKEDPKKEDPKPKKEEPEPRKEEPTPEENTESKAVLALRLQGAQEKQDFFPDAENPKNHILTGGGVKKLCGGAEYPPIIGVLQSSAGGKTWSLLNGLSGEWSILRNGEPVASSANLASDDTLTLQKAGEVQAKLSVRFRVLINTKIKKE